MYSSYKYSLISDSALLQVVLARTPLLYSLVPDPVSQVTWNDFQCKWKTKDVIFNSLSKFGIVLVYQNSIHSVCT